MLYAVCCMSPNNQATKKKKLFQSISPIEWVLHDSSLKNLFSLVFLCPNEDSRFLLLFFFFSSSLISLLLRKKKLQIHLEDISWWNHLPKSFCMPRRYWIRLEMLICNNISIGQILSFHKNFRFYKEIPLFYVRKVLFFSWPAIIAMFRWLLKKWSHKMQITCLHLVRKSKSEEIWIPGN